MASLHVIQTSKPEPRIIRGEFSEHEWTAIKPMLRNNVRGVRQLDDRRVRDGIVWVLRSGAPWRDLSATYGPVDVLQSLGSVDDGAVALICPTCQRSTSGARRVPATVHGVVFNILAGSADPG